MVDLKPTNPKDSVGIRKAPMSTVSSPFIFGVGLAKLEGARKYGRHNYREAGVLSSVYYDAAMRHLMSWWEGEDIDPDSGLSHLVKAAACMAVLFDSMTYGNLKDDRPPKHREGWLAVMNEAAGKIIDRYPTGKPPVTAEALMAKYPVQEVPLQALREKADLHEGETPVAYTTEEGGEVHTWPIMEGPLPRFTYFSKRYRNGDIWDARVGWR